MHFVIFSAKTAIKTFWGKNRKNKNLNFHNVNHQGGGLFALQHFQTARTFFQIAVHAWDLVTFIFNLFWTHPLNQIYPKFFELFLKKIILRTKVSCRANRPPPWWFTLWKFKFLFFLFFLQKGFIAILAEKITKCN